MGGDCNWERNAGKSNNSLTLIMLYIKCNCNKRIICIIFILPTNIGKYYVQKLVCKNYDILNINMARLSF